MTNWSKLDQELDRWSTKSEHATFWWRDDDAVSVTPDLKQLFAVTIENRIPLGLAVIPAGADTELIGWLTDKPGVSVLQHGLAHRNYAGPGEKAAELGLQRGLTTVLNDLDVGKKTIMKFKHTVPVLVPPWNRIDPALFPHLPERGYRAVSCFAPRSQREAAPGLVFLNTHLDPHNFKKKQFVGSDKAINLLVEHLEQRRLGLADPDEPTGILTHHLVHPPEAWDFLAEMANRLNNHPAARWLSPEEAIR